jgi:class 3 adenylate cyclase
MADNSERRHLTMLFCDQVSSAEIPARLDPEDWREVVAGYRARRRGGYAVRRIRRQVPK